MSITDIKHDRDSSKDVWEKLYNIIYKENFNSIFDFERLEDKETSSKCKRWYLKIDRKQQPRLSREYPKFKIAGDCIFNFNRKKQKLFQKLLKEDDYPQLEYCGSRHYDLCNFSFMPITGGMNNKKGTLCWKRKERAAYDRFDLFLYELNQYYTGKPCRIFSRYNQRALTWFLGFFRDVYDYCEKIYLIDDRKFVDAIIVSGTAPINSREKALSYMNLAKRYWSMKAEKLKGYGIDFESSDSIEINDFT